MDSMPAVLVIAYFFPPMGGAGVQRTLKFAKYLPDFGWQPHVLTVRNAAGVLDPSLASEIPAKLPITRTRILQLPPSWPWRLRNFISRWFLIVDEQIGWLPFATSAGRKVITQDNIQVIYSSSTPYTAHLIAYQLHHQTKLPWVADFRDPWVGNTSVNVASSAHAQLVKYLEQLVIRGASRIVVVSEPMRQMLLDRYPSLEPTKVLVIPNGFDPQDFAASVPADPEKDRFVIVYSGSFYGSRQQPNFFFKALQQALEAEQISADRIRVRLVGKLNPALQHYVRSSPLADVIQLTGYLPHHQTVSQLLASDALLLIIGAGPGSEAVFTGKIFEYLAARKPILALVPPGAASDLIQLAQAGEIASPEDIQAINNILVKLYQKWLHGILPHPGQTSIIEQYDRRKLTERLANLLTEVCT